MKIFKLLSISLILFQLNLSHIALAQIYQKKADTLHYDNFLSELYEFLSSEMLKGYTFYHSKNKEILPIGELIINPPEELYILSPKLKGNQFSIKLTRKQNLKESPILFINITIYDKEFKNIIAGPRAIEINTNKDSIENLNTIKKSLKIMIKLANTKLKPLDKENIKYFISNFLKMAFYLSLCTGIISIIEISKSFESKAYKKVLGFRVLLISIAMMFLTSFIHDKYLNDYK